MKANKQEYYGYLKDYDKGIMTLQVKDKNGTVFTSNTTSTATATYGPKIIDTDDYKFGYNLNDSTADDILYVKVDTDDPVLEVMKYTSVLLFPVIPNIAQKIYTQLGFEGNIKDVKLSDLNNLSIKEGQIASKETISPVFLRLDSEIAKDKKK